MKRSIFLATILSGCFSGDSRDDFGDGATSGAGTYSSDPSDSSVHTTATGSGSGETTTATTTGTDAGGGSSADSSSDDGETATETAGSTGVTGATETGSSSTTGGAGQMRFPGDICDPFVDWCLDGYECMREATLAGEIHFTCRDLFDDFGGTGLYGETCHQKSNDQCVTGFMCANKQYFPQDFCPQIACCAQLCRYQEICPNGMECEITLWQASLEGYLDQYTGIGICKT
jgi:hypothetical protein